MWSGSTAGSTRARSVRPPRPWSVRVPIASGKLKVFTGPIKGQDESIKVAAGKSLTDKDIDSINWYTEGVEGKLPAN